MTDRMPLSARNPTVKDEVMNPVRIGLLGLGTVGCGTVAVLARNADEIARRAGRGITVVAAVRALTADPENRVPHLAFQPDALSDGPILPMEAVRTSFYLRLRAHDRPGVLADITRVLGQHAISIEAILQREPDPGRGEATIIILTHEVLEGDMQSAIAELEQLPHLSSPVTRIRMEPLGR